MKNLIRIDVPKSVTDFGEGWLSGSDRAVIYTTAGSTAAEYAAANNIQTVILQ